MSPVEIWAGVECTVVRLGDRFRDQSVLTGHHERSADIDLIASLGVKTVRYPVLWERVAPERPDRLDWRWSDERLGQLRAHGIAPVVGLVHHGSGPAYTSLAEASFAAGLERFADAVAERYPWVELWTPVNEALTTARFSGLYGHWYPHGRDNASFLRILLNEVDAVRRAMRAIRRHCPKARLVQTDDLGRIFATKTLSYQADYENERRWLGWDLLAGRVGPCHPLWPDLRSSGLADAAARMADDPCPPDVIGINHYLSSDRFLDHRLRRYPEWLHGGNDRHRYVDVEAARTLVDWTPGYERLLAEAWERYRTPIAITEVHNGCSREEQLRWFTEAWEAAQRAVAAGVDLRAITAWSLFGCVDWRSLLTRDDLAYEAGVFDVRSPQPRATALAHALRGLNAGKAPDHPVLAAPGWWRRPDRLIYRNARAAGSHQPRQPKRRTPVPRPVLIAGATGTLGGALARICRARGIAYRLVGRQEMDIAEPNSVAALIAETRPWAIVNAAGFVRVDEAEHQSARCMRENVEGARVLARSCKDAGIRLATLSSDLVFDGEKQVPYHEGDTVSPLNAYGRSKVGAENAVMAILPDSLVVRTSAFFGPWDRHNFVWVCLDAMRRGQRVQAAADVTVSPTYVPDLAEALLDILIDGETGLWHLATVGAVTWAELARETASRAHLDPALVEPVASESLGWLARRPAYSVLASRRATLMPPLDRALGRYFSSLDAAA